jgi:hypothetical protein
MSYEFLVVANNKGKLEIINISHIISVCPVNYSSTETPLWAVNIYLTGSKYVRCDNLETMENILQILNNGHSVIKTDPAKLILGYTSK